MLRECLELLESTEVSGGSVAELMRLILEILSDDTTVSNGGKLM